MSGKFVITKQRTKYRFDLRDENGDVIFKGSFASSKEDAERKVKLIQGFGEKFGDHMMVMPGPRKDFALRAEEQEKSEGMGGHVGDALPLGFSQPFADEAEAEGLKAKIVEAALGAEVVDETGE